jgi:hypothetical protein
MQGVALSTTCSMDAQDVRMLVSLCTPRACSMDNGHARCISLHLQKYGRARCISFHYHSMDVEDVFLCNTSSMDVQDVSLCTPRAVCMCRMMKHQQYVWACRIYLFAPLAVWMCRMMKHQQYVWACRIYLFAAQAVWMCRMMKHQQDVSLFTTSSKYGRAGCISLHHK